MNSLSLRFGLSAGLLAILAIVGCTTRKSPSPPPPSYPSVPANSVRILERLPSPPYESINTIVIQNDASINRDKTISEIRQRAGNSGANVIVVVSEKVFSWRNSAIYQRLHTRRIVARAIRVP
jgi:hypothetical protein